MPANLLRPGAVQLRASAASAVTVTSPAIEIPLADSYTFISDVTAASGTTPTLDLVIQVTPDNGTTWYPAIKFTQQTGVSTRRIQVQGSMGRGEAGSETALANTGAAVSANTIITKKIRYVATIAGTNPSFTFAIWLLCVPKAQASY